MSHRTCSVPDCDHVHQARGLCQMHYLRWYNHPEENAGIIGDSSWDLTIEQRFWAQVEKTPTCWLWTGARNDKGYGVGYGNGGSKRRYGAHRVAYEYLVGPIPTGLELDHLCRARACVNPVHLEPVTHAENIARGQRARRLLASQRTMTLSEPNGKKEIA